MDKKKHPKYSLKQTKWLLLVAQAKAARDIARLYESKADKIVDGIIKSASKEHSYPPKYKIPKSHKWMVAFWKKQFELGENSPIFKADERVREEFGPAIALLRELGLCNGSAHTYARDVLNL